MSEWIIYNDLNVSAKIFISLDIEGLHEYVTIASNYTILKYQSFFLWIVQIELSLITFLAYTLHYCIEKLSFPYRPSDRMYVHLCITSSDVLR